MWSMKPTSTTHEGVFKVVIFFFEFPRINSATDHIIKILLCGSMG